MSQTNLGSSTLSEWKQTYTALDAKPRAEREGETMWTSSPKTSEILVQDVVIVTVGGQENNFGNTKHSHAPYQNILYETLYRITI